MSKKKADIVIYSKGYFALPAFWFILFAPIAKSFVNFYIINKKPIGVHFIVSIIAMTIFLGISIYIYHMFGSKIYIYGNKIIAKKWYGLRTTYYVRDIDKVIFEKSGGKIAAIQIITKDFQEKYFEGKINFDKLINYLIENVSPEKIFCYILGTKMEIPL